MTGKNIEKVAMLINEGDDELSLITSDGGFAAVFFNPDNDEYVVEPYQDNIKEVFGGKKIPSFDDFGNEFIGVSRYAEYLSKESGVNKAVAKALEELVGDKAKFIEICTVNLENLTQAAFDNSWVKSVNEFVFDKQVPNNCKF